MRQRKKNEMKETMKSTTRKWYFDGWMFRELDNLEGEHEKHPTKTTKARHLSTLARG